MKYLTVGIGTEKVDESTRRFSVDIGLRSTKPANEQLRNYVASAIAVIAFALSIMALNGAQP